MKRLGFLDGRRLVIGGMPSWSGVPALLIPGQLQAFGIFEEFFKSTELAARESPTGWETAVFAGGGTFTIADHFGGCGLWQTAAGNNASIQSTLGSNDGGAFWPQINKDIWFEAKMKHSYVQADENLAFGLIDPGAAVILTDNGAACVIQNRLMFSVLDGESDWSFGGDKVGTFDRNPLTQTPVDLVFHTFGFHVHGIDATGLLPGQVDVYVDRVLVAAGRVLTASIPITGLMPFVAIKSGSGNVEAIYMDYIMCVQER